jgi:hypothetical protein
MTRRLKVGFCDVHCYAATSQNARCIRCDCCYSTDTQQFLTVKRFLSNQIVATENTTVRKRCSLSNPEDLFKGVDLDNQESVNNSRSVSQLAVSIRKKKRSKDHSEARYQRVRTHCKREIVTTNCGVINRRV